VEEPGAVAAFLEFLTYRSGAPRLVVLGDLFEYWLGPAHQRTPGGQSVVEALAGRVAAGGDVDVVPGNRDFLLDANFERATGARILRDGFVGLLPGGGRAVFLHGDELATRDRSYQRLRGVLRSRVLLGLAPRLPLALSRRLAGRLRRASKRALDAKPPEEKSLQAEAAAACMRDAAATWLVCGHAHEFRDVECDGAGRWLVLDAFGGARDALEVDPEHGLRVTSSRGAG
jgi:UDP-2,3-diacylglucosamine hydrolase